MSDGITTQINSNATIVPAGEKKERVARCRLCGNKFSRVLLEIKLPVISHFMGGCPTAPGEIERMAGSFIHLVEE